MECSSLFAKSMSGFSTGERSRKGDQWNLYSQSSKFPLKPKEENGGEKDFTLPGQGGIVSVDVWLWKWNSKASISKIYVLAARSFQSSDWFVCLFLKMRKGVCDVVVCVPGYRHKHKCLAYGSFFAFCPLLSASLLAVLWITRRSDCLTQGQNFEVKNVSFGMWNCH